MPKITNKNIKRKLIKEQLYIIVKAFSFFRFIWGENQVKGHKKKKFNHRKVRLLKYYLRLIALPAAASEIIL